jgi:hypothetical protein
VCGCDITDGYDDLLLKFDRQAIVEAIGEVEDGECLVLELTGEEFGCRIIVGVRWDKPTRKRVQPRNRMRENRTSGTVSGNRHSYHDDVKIKTRELSPNGQKRQRFCP